ncbi:MAG: glucose-6-phosphate dehydrogenase, partial [Caldilineaceae bacterium]|nr:glucose-6-phosphate dehydrogenase [Caldilineaceae bacterium]
MKQMTEPVMIVVFGASGDLVKRKLVPALYHLAKDELLSSDFILLGYARSEYDDQSFRKDLLESLRDHMDSEHENGSVDETVWSEFEQRLFYLSGQYDERESFDRLAQRIKQLQAEYSTDKTEQRNLLFYLATPPEVFAPITDLLAAVRLAQPKHIQNDGGWTRIIIEKPFGHDLDSAVSLNNHLLERFDEDQIYRIDHYLGKETVQNIMVFRFGNGLFEPVWNRNYVDHVQVTVAESIGVGSRGGYYDQSGALRDMVQNHLMQLVALTAMEPPVAFDAKAVRDQKVNVMHSIRRLDEDAVRKSVVRAQYTRGEVNGKELPGYLETEGIADDSTTPTY